ncbi:MAG: excisionase family DNA-binding protein [Vicinamibacterales bacterium]
MGDPIEPSTLTFLIEEAARLMGVSRRTVYYRIREGRLTTIRTRCGSRRVVVSSLDELVRVGWRKNGRQATDRT